MGDDDRYIEPRIHEVLDAMIATTKNGYQLFKLKIRNHNNTFWATKLVPIKKIDRLHDTGHEARCKRDMSNEKTSYAFEELVAELSATILCRRFNISPQPREDHSKYIHSWLKSLKNDKTMIVEAMKKASTAISWMDRQQNA